jgi:outer membrane immunogenic protein
MNRRMRIFVNTLLLSLATAAVAQQKPSNTIDASITFSELRANAPVGGCGCFWMAGAVGGFSVPVWHNFSAVVEAGGHTTDHIPGFNTGLSLFYGMGGIRMRLPNHTRFQPFGQALFGGVHGFDGYFPAPVGKSPTSYDTSYAATVGGGLDIALSRHVWIRAVQADYFYSELRNVQGDRQNQLRIGAGVLFRGSDFHWKH